MMRLRAIVIAIGVLCVVMAATVYLPPKIQDMQGRVVDVEGKGIEGVYYYIEFRTGRFIPLPLDHGGPQKTCIQVAAGVTDANGTYEIDRPTSLFKQILIALNPFLDIEVEFTAYKPGYSYVLGARQSYDGTITYPRTFTFFFWGKNPLDIELPGHKLDPDRRLRHLFNIYPSKYSSDCGDEHLAEVRDQFRAWMRPELQTLIPLWVADLRSKGRTKVSPSYREFLIDVFGYDPLAEAFPPAPRPASSSKAPCTTPFTPTAEVEQTRTLR